MNEIIIAVVIVAAIGIITGFGLSIASSVFAVKKDEKEEKIRECLPGANCGACGFSGCDGYAKALAAGEATSVSLCNPGGDDAATAIGEILGITAEKITPMAAVVMCAGDSENAKAKLEYKGVRSCKAAAQLFGGYKACVYGCLGYGDCMKACPYDAIFICNGVARVDTQKCRACKKCVNTCPKGIIEMLPLNTPQAAVICKNHDKGVETRKECTVGCIGCGKCMRACEHGAVTVENFTAKVDYTKCVGCGKCNEACPVKCIDIITLKKDVQ